MELSVLIARILAVVYLSASLGLFFSGDYYRKISYDTYRNAGLTFMMGFIGVIVGFLIVHYHNLWRSDWTVLITLIGWLSLVKGVFLIIFPKFIHHLTELILTDRCLKIVPYLTLVWGLLFAYFGFFI